jgi:hypothetical protein
MKALVVAAAERAPVTAAAGGRYGGGQKADRSDGFRTNWFSFEGQQKRSLTAGARLDEERKGEKLLLSKIAAKLREKTY